MAYIGMAYIVMAPYRYGLYSYGMACVQDPEGDVIIYFACLAEVGGMKGSEVAAVRAGLPDNDANMVEQILAEIFTARLRIGRSIDMCGDACIDMCIGTCSDVYRQVCKCIDMCIDICTHDCI